METANNEEVYMKLESIQLKTQLSTGYSWTLKEKKGEEFTSVSIIWIFLIQQ